MSKRHEMRKAELGRAHHAEMGEHAEAAMAEARAEVLRAELVKEQTDRLGFPLPTDALESNIAALEAEAATLRARDEELTKQIIEAHVAGREGDPGIARERRGPAAGGPGLPPTPTPRSRRLGQG